MLSFIEVTKISASISPSKSCFLFCPLQLGFSSKGACFVCQGRRGSNGNVCCYMDQHLLVSFWGSFFTWLQERLPSDSRFCPRWLVATSSLPLMALPLFVLSEWWSALGVPFLSYLSRSSQSSLSGYPHPSPRLEATAVCWAYHVHVFPLLSPLPLGLLMAHCFPPLKPPLRCCLLGEGFPDHTM